MTEAIIKSLRESKGARWGALAVVSFTMMIMATLMLIPEIKHGRGRHIPSSQMSFEEVKEAIMANERKRHGDRIKRAWRARL